MASNNYQDPKKAGVPESDLSALLELREFLATELDPIGSHNQVDRALKPLTDGLGLESPKHLETAGAPVVLLPEGDAAGSLSGEQPKPRSERPAFTPGRSALSPTTYEEPPLREKGLADVISPEDTREERKERAAAFQDETLIPPPLPSKASFFRRFFSGLLDEAFVGALFLIAFGLTIRTMSAGSGPITLDLVRSIDSQILIRFALLEYSMIWLSYLAIAIGVLDSTFGMWVWGLRFSYPQERLGSVLWKKAVRIFFSFFFFTGIIPLLLLGFRWKGKNLLDLLSGIGVYRNVGS